MSDIYELAVKLAGRIMHEEIANRQSLINVIESEVTKWDTRRAAVAGPQEPHCWHCGIVLEPTELRLRCDQCSADCDDESCNAFGCAPTTAATSSPVPAESERFPVSPTPNDYGVKGESND